MVSAVERYFVVVVRGDGGGGGGGGGDGGGSMITVLSGTGEEREVVMISEVMWGDRG